MAVNDYKPHLFVIPEDVRDRVFLLGTLDDPQAFKRSIKLTFEDIGNRLADECFQQEFILWKHDHLAHIRDEIDRAAATLHPVLFSTLDRAVDKDGSINN